MEDEEVMVVVVVVRVMVGTAVAAVILIVVVGYHQQQQCRTRLLGRRLHMRRIPSIIALRDTQKHTQTTASDNRLLSAAWNPSD